LARIQVSSLVSWCHSEPALGQSPWLAHHPLRSGGRRYRERRISAIPICSAGSEPPRSFAKSIAAPRCQPAMFDDKVW